MVMGIMPEPKMVKKLNPGWKVVCTKVEPEWKVAKLSPREELHGFNTQPEMVKKLSTGGDQVVCITVVQEWKVVNFSPSEEPPRFSTEPWFKPKIGSVIPAKRRLVKRMMFDYIAQSIAFVFRPRR